MCYVFHTFTQLFSFSGRANRKEFWYFVLFLFFADFAIAAAEMLLTGDVTIPWKLKPKDEQTASTILVCIWYITVFIASISLSIRRFHDIGHTGCLLFLLLIPLTWIILGCIGGTPGSNRYGLPFVPGYLR